jgi:hypothetical protein
MYSDIVAGLFGIGPSTQIGNYEREGRFMLQGLTREGSHLVYSLFTGILILFVDSKVSKNQIINTLFILIGLIEISLSMAFTSALVYCLLLLLYLVYRNYIVRDAISIVTKIVLFVVVPLLIVTANSISFLSDSYLMHRLTGATEDMRYLLYFNKVNSTIGLRELSSAMSRFYSIISNLSLLQIRPLFGVGIGTNFSHGSTAWTLGETGILGLLTYLHLVFFTNPVRRKKLVYILVILIFIFGNLFVSRPILMVRFDCFVFYVMLYLLWDKLFEKKSEKFLC